MPIYEYRCEDCGKKTTVVTLSMSAEVRPKCRHCGGLRLTKMISQVAVLRSDESRLERMSDPTALTGLDEEDPKSVARWMKKMGKEMGEDLGDDFDEEVDRAVEDAEKEKQGGEGDRFGGGSDDENF
jgi:putative FmdB family regulatory protein